LFSFGIGIDGVGVAIFRAVLILTVFGLDLDETAAPLDKVGVLRLRVGKSIELLVPFLGMILLC
jgi:hypothetical protein